MSHWKRYRRLLALVLGVGMLIPLQASAIKLRVGDILVIADGGFAPTELPRFRNAPIRLYGGGRVSTVSGDLPPILKTIDIEYDRHGSLETVGLPFCTQGRLEATTPAQARRKCGGAIVGKGRGAAVIAFDEQAPFRVSSPITIFNGPKRNGNHTVLAHAYLERPVVTVFIVPVEIERVNRGLYGYRTRARIPEIAGGAGIPVSGHLTIDRKWTFKGRRRSYVNARCETGVLQARGRLDFDDGTALKGTIFKPCTVRR